MQNQNSLVAQLRDTIERLEGELAALKEQEVRMRREIRQHKKALKALDNAGQEVHRG